MSALLAQALALASARRRRSSCSSCLRLSSAAFSLRILSSSSSRAISAADISFCCIDGRTDAQTEVVACVQEAALLAVDTGAESLAEAHILASIAATKPQITESDLAFYADIAAKYH